VCKASVACGHAFVFFALLVAGWGSDEQVQCNYAAAAANGVGLIFLVDLPSSIFFFFLGCLLYYQTLASGMDHPVDHCLVLHASLESGHVGAGSH
jgi:hypothetical protein